MVKGFTVGVTWLLPSVTGGLDKARRVPDLSHRGVPEFQQLPRSKIAKSSGFVDDW